MIDKQQLSIEDYEICNKLKSMRFSGMAEALKEVFEDPNAELLPFREKIQRIVDAEWNLRYTKKLNRFIKKATLKYPAADLDDTIYNPERQLDVHIIEELAKCEWIEQGKNLVITGKTSSGNQDRYNNPDYRISSNSELLMIRFGEWILNNYRKY